MENQGSNITKWLKMVLWSIVAIAMLGVTLRFSLKTQLVLEFIASNIETTASDESGFDLQIGGISGDAWKMLELDDVVISSEFYNVQLDEISIKYALREVIFGNVFKEITLEGSSSTIWLDSLMADFEQEAEEDYSEEEIQFRIESLIVTNSNFTIQSDNYLPDTTASIKNLTLMGAISNETVSSITIKQLDFEIETESIPEEISVQLGGALSDNQVDLSELIIGVGSSLITGSFSVNTEDQTIGAELESPNTNPVDLGLSEKIFEIEPIDASLTIEGSFGDFSLSLNLDSPQLHNGNVSVDIQYSDEFSIKSLEISADYINTFDMFDSLQIVGGPISFESSGLIVGFDEENAFDFKGGFSNLEINELGLENMMFSGSQTQDQLESQVQLKGFNGETIEAEFDVDSLFAEHPNWEMEYFIQRFDPSMFFGQAPTSDITASGKIESSSFSIPDSAVHITIKNINPNTGESIPWIVDEQQIDKVEGSFEVSLDRFLAESTVKIASGSIDVHIQAFNPFDETLEYTYQLNVDEFDAGAIVMFAGNNTRLNGEIYGIGKGVDPTTANLFGTMIFEESAINGANIESFKASVLYDSGIINIREGNLQSEIAAGSISGQRDIFDITNPENQFNLDLQIKNLVPLAGFFGLSYLSANGSLKGAVSQNADGDLIGNFDLNLEKIQVDSSFEAKSVVGFSALEITDRKVFNANIGIVEPIISGITFQDILMQTNGFVSEDSLEALFDLTVIGSERGRLIQKGSVHKDFEAELTDIQFEQFDFESAESDLRLQQPFNVRVFKDAFGTDTLRLSAEDGAFLEFSIPFAGETEQMAFIHGEEFNTGLIQEIIFGERFFDGIASGEIFYHQTPGDVIGSGSAKLDEIYYMGASADSLLFGFDIINERLSMAGNLYWDGIPSITGWADFPFVIHKEELDEEFFNRPVRGELEMRSTNLAQFDSLLANLGYENTSGIVHLSGTMSGQAGTPSFTGLVEIDDPILSGIPVDRLSAEFNYSNPEKEIVLQSEIFAQNTSVAELNIEYPFNLDFRTFELILPDEQDIIEISAITNDLNLAIFNDFVDPLYMKSMRGRLNVNLDFNGPLGDIKPYGYFNLRGGYVEVPILGIQLRNMAMQLDVNENELTVSRVYAESGRGRVNATGTSTLNGIIPDEIDLKVDSRLFQIANNRDMRMTVDVNAEMNGTAKQPNILGDILVNSGFYMVPNFGEEAIEEIVLEDEWVNNFVPFDSLKIEMSLELKRDFYIRSRDFLDMEFEPKGILEISKERSEDALLFGSLNVSDGYIRPLGKRFTVEEGTLSFIGDYENPELDIRSAYIPQTRQKGESVVLYYLISGTRYDPEFSFESDPFMEQENVICYVLFNQPCYALDSWQSVFTKGNDTQAFQALTDVLIDEIETIATRELGVDIVQIDNSGQNGATAIRTGWYLNERTFFTIVNELTSSTPKTLFILEYLLSENWDLIITQGDDARQGIDVRYQFDY